MLLDINTSIRYHSIIDDLVQKKQFLFDKIHNNISNRKSMIIQDDVHSMIDEMEVMIKEISVFNKVNNPTAKWMHSQISELRSLDFEPHEIRNKLLEKEQKVQGIISFLRTKH